MRVSTTLGGFAAGLIVWFLYGSPTSRVAAGLTSDEMVDAIDSARIAGAFFLLAAAAVWNSPVSSMVMYGIATVASFAMVGQIEDGWLFVGAGISLAISCWWARKEKIEQEDWESEFRIFVRQSNAASIRTFGTMPDTSFHSQLATARAKLEADSRRLSTSDQ